MTSDVLTTDAKEKRVSVELVEQVRLAGRLPVVTFAAGGLATPADVAMLMCLGVDGTDSSAPASLRAKILPLVPVQWSLRARTTNDPILSPRCQKVSAKAMVGLLEHEDPVVVAKQRADAANATLMTENLGGFKRSKDPRDYYVAEEEPQGGPDSKEACVPCGRHRPCH